jgi:hypothetical protein
MAIYESFVRLVSEYQALNVVVMAVPGKFQSCSGVLLVLRDGYKRELTSSGLLRGQAE